MNPYNWRGHRPRVEVSRSEVESVALDLKRGGSGVLLAGRGMGKSVFLWQVYSRLEELPDVRPIFFPGPPDDLTIRSCLRVLARRLGIEAGEARDTQELLESYFAEASEQHLVLIYDELDRYARIGGAPSESVGRNFFNNLEVMRRTHEPRLGILAAGGIGVFLFRDVLGSSFIARADGVRIGPFDHEQIHRLAQPFAGNSEPLSDGVLEAIQTASGGVPALVIYGLESLWTVERPTERRVADIYGEFQERHYEFIRDFQSSFSDPGLSRAPERVLELIQKAGGAVSHAELRRSGGGHIKACSNKSRAIGRPTWQSEPWSC